MKVIKRIWIVICLIVVRNAYDEINLDKNEYIVRYPSTFYENQSISYQVYTEDLQDTDLYVAPKEQDCSSKFILKVEMIEPVSQLICTEELFVQNNICYYEFDYAMPSIYQIHLQCISPQCNVKVHISNSKVQEDQYYSDYIGVKGLIAKYDIYEESYIQLYAQFLNKVLVLNHHKDGIIYNPYLNTVIKKQKGKSTLLFIFEEEGSGEMRIEQKRVLYGTEFNLFKKRESILMFRNCLLVFKNQIININSEETYQIESELEQYKITCEQPTYLLQDYSFNKAKIILNLHKLSHQQYTVFRHLYDERNFEICFTLYSPIFSFFKIPLEKNTKDLFDRLKDINSPDDLMNIAPTQMEQILSFTLGGEICFETQDFMFYIFSKENENVYQLEMKKHETYPYARTFTHTIQIDGNKHLRQILFYHQKNTRIMVKTKLEIDDVIIKFLKNFCHSIIYSTPIFFLLFFELFE